MNVTFLEQPNNPGLREAGTVPAPKLDEMQDLLAHAERLAEVVREELHDLRVSRDAFLAAVAREQQEREREAIAHAEEIIAGAQATAKATLERAAEMAAEIAAEARADHQRLIEVNSQYRSALLESISMLAGLPEIPAPSREVSVEVVVPDPPMSQEVAGRFFDATKRAP